MGKYIGICYIPYIETVSVKIKADSEQGATKKFMEYLLGKGFPEYYYSDENISIIDLAYIDSI